MKPSDCCNEMFIGSILILWLPSILAISKPLILTDLIKQNLSEQARDMAAVDPALFLGRNSYSGFFTVDEKHDTNLFFWYIEAEMVSRTTPWIIWLQGGPGASSLAGLFDEIGPFEFDTSRERISARKSTWAKDHSLLFIDNPAGAGFSYARDVAGLPHSVDKCADHLYIALRQFVMVFPELRNAPLYIAGESYAGRYVPALGVKILEQNQSIGALEVNFQGILLGNPVFNRDSIVDFSSIYYYWGLIDSQGLQAVRPLQEIYNKAVHEGDNDKAISARRDLLDKLDAIANQQNDYNVLLDRLDQLANFKSFVTRDDVREALHVGDLNFKFSDPLAHRRLSSDFLIDMKSKVESLLDHHYRVLVYCGQLDLTTPCVLNAEARRRHWYWNGRAQFLSSPRTPWRYKKTIAGYVKSGGGLTEVLVRGAGHLAPMDKPEEVTQLITYFIQGLDLPQPPFYHALAEYTPEYIESDTPGSPLVSSDSGPGAGFITSIVINVLLISTIVGGVCYAIWWKKRHDRLLSIERHRNSAHQLLL